VRALSFLNLLFSFVLPVHTLKNDLSLRIKPSFYFPDLTLRIQAVKS